MAKRILSWELVDHGIDGSQYFPGCCSGDFQYKATGCGDTPAEAFDDLLEMLAQTHDDLDLGQLEKDILSGEGLDKMPDEPSASDQFLEDTDRQEGETDEDCLEDCELQYYMSLRYNVEDDAEPDGPQEGDITTEDYIKWFQYGKRVLTTLKPGPHTEPADDWQQQLQAYMDKEQFWPNVWFISDHGNAYPVLFLEETPGEAPL